MSNYGTPQESASTLLSLSFSNTNHFNVNITTLQWSTTFPILPPPYVLSFLFWHPPPRPKNPVWKSSASGKLSAVLGIFSEPLQEYPQCPPSPKVLPPMHSVRGAECLAFRTKNGRLKKIHLCPGELFPPTQHAPQKLWTCNKKGLLMA